MKSLEELKVEFPQYKFNDDFCKAIDLIQKGNKCINIIGKAGSGKSSLLCVLKSMLENYNVVVTSTTGVASALLNSNHMGVNATTLHSALKILPQDIYGTNLSRISSEVIELIEATDYLFIDEVSMLNSSLFDYIFELIQYICAKCGKDFPTIILFGDILQLPPVVKNEPDIKAYYKEYYNGNVFYFNSHYYRDRRFVTIELQKIYRQENDDTFKDILNTIRVGEISDKDLEILNQRVVDEDYFMVDNESALKLCTTNKEVQYHNDISLKSNPNPFICVLPSITGNFRDSAEYKSGAYPEKLWLKIDSPVMITRNDTENKAFVNGDMGILKSYDSDNKIAYVEIGVGDNKRTVLVPEFKTEIFEYQVSKDDYNKPKVESKSVASYTCLGLKNASASTFHKTQGLTLSKGYIYLSNWTPESGVYTCLSRFRNMNDFGLKRPIKKSDIRVNKEALDFVNNLKKTE